MRSRATDISPGDLVLVYGDYRSIPFGCSNGERARYINVPARGSEAVAHGVVLGVRSLYSNLFSIDSNGSDCDITVLFSSGEIGYALDAGGWVQKL